MTAVFSMDVAKNFNFEDFYRNFRKKRWIEFPV